MLIVPIVLNGLLRKKRRLGEYSGPRGIRMGVVKAPS